MVFSPEAEIQLVELYRYIAIAASPAIAERFTDAIVTHCESLRTFPYRGIQRDDIRPGLRITSFRKRVVIAFSIDVNQVAILGVFYGGRDYESLLQDDDGSWQSEEAQ